MDFVTGFTRTQRKHDAIWVVVIRLTKSATFSSIRKGLPWELPTITVGSVHLYALPFEMLYGRKCRAPICWDQVGERILEGPEMNWVGLMKRSPSPGKALRGYKYHPLHVVSYPFDQIREDLSYTEEPESILDRQDRVMRNKTIPFVKILWRNHPEREATWETEESIRTSYPHFLP
ncbi:retrotransposon protein, putative, ty3-gypsy subclass [Tanacetum coccineum]